MKLLVLFFGVLMLGNVADAETPREQLKQMVEQLQKNLGDNALREKIIKLVQELKPAPSVPEEAEKFEGRGQFAYKNSESPADLLAAAKEYEKAIAAAPWVPGYYSDICTIYEKAKKYAEAKKNCEFFLLSSPSAQDASDVRKRIAGLEFAIEKANLSEVRAAQEKNDQQAAARQAALDLERERELIKSLNGIGFQLVPKSFPSGYRYVNTSLDIKDGVVTWEMRHCKGDEECQDTYLGKTILTGRHFKIKRVDGREFDFEITPKGNIVWPASITPGEW